jgi:Protein of unknown function (DUF3011)
MRRTSLALGMMLALVAGPLTNVAVAQQSTVTCESTDGNERFCPADTRGGVVLSAQLSRSACRQGQSWGYDNRGIWTSNGCRARFTVGSSSHRDSDRGNNAAAAAAAVALLAVGAAAVHQEHKEDRRERERYDDYRGNGYYDYRPEPQHRYPPDYYNGGGGSDTVTCESQDGRQRFCPLSVGRGRVELTRQLSRGECRFGRNWGYDRRGVWVNDGCRGQFTAYY